MRQSDGEKKEAETGREVIGRAEMLNAVCFGRRRRLGITLTCVVQVSVSGYE